MLWCHFTSTMSVLYAATTFVHKALLIEADEHMTRLYHQLLIDYNKEIRPVIRQNMPVNTSIAFSLVQVVDVDERNQLLTSLAWIHFRWNDWRLAWDPQLNGQLTKLNVPFESIWIPDIILYNNAAQEYLKEMTTASVTYDGNISLSMAGIFKSSCALDVRFYPFDFQNCLMKFASWAYDGTKIDIWSDSKGDQSNYMVSTEWTLREVLAKKNSIIYSCCPEPYPFIDVHLLLERKPLFFVIFLCLPCVLISLLVLLGFYMPSDSGEKVTLGITSLLSTTVFLMLVSEHLPPTADALPLIGIYYGVTIFIVSLQTAFTVFTLNIHHIGTHGSPVPPLLQYLLFGRFAGFLLLSIEPRYHSINEHVQYFFLKQSAEEKERRRQSQESDEPPVWELASAVSAAGKNVRQSPPTANGNNKATTASADGSGRVSRKRVSFPELPPESPPLLYQQNGGTSTGVRHNRRRVLSLVSGTSPSRRLASAKMLLQQLPPLPTVAASPLPPPSPTGTEHHNSCCSSLASSSASPLLNTEAAVVEEEAEELNFEAEFIRVLSRLKEVIERNELRLVEKDRRNAEKLEWQQVALVLDRFLLVLFSICTVAVLFSTVFQCSKRSSLW